jgi:hypothetical protein
VSLAFLYRWYSITHSTRELHRPRTLVFLAVFQTLFSVPTTLPVLYGIYYDYNAVLSDVAEVCFFDLRTMFCFRKSAFREFFVLNTLFSRSFLFRKIAFYVKIIPFLYFFKFLFYFSCSELSGRLPIQYIRTSVHLSFHESHANCGKLKF